LNVGRLTRSSRAGLVLLALLAGGCADDDGSGVHAAVRGTVRDASTNKRVANATVEFESDTLDRSSDRTNGSGEYTINVESETTTGRLTVTKAGYRASVVSVFLDDGDVTVDIALRPE
jgi:flagellar hook assembly protein FlgD